MNDIDYAVDPRRCHEELVQWLERDVESRYGEARWKTAQRSVADAVDYTVSASTRQFDIEETWRIGRSPWPGSRPIDTRWHGRFYGTMVSSNQRGRRDQFFQAYTMDPGAWMS